MFTPRPAQEGAPAVDYVIAGEGERTMAELLRGLAGDAAGGTLSPAEVRGLTWRDGGGTIRSAPLRDPIEDVDGLPFPLREPLVYTRDIRRVFYQAVITLRGCPYRCVYCAVPSSNDRKTRYRTAQNVLDEIAYLRDRYDIPGSSSTTASSRFTVDEPSRSVRG